MEEELFFLKALSFHWFFTTWQFSHDFDLTLETYVLYTEKDRWYAKFYSQEFFFKDVDLKKEPYF